VYAAMPDPRHPMRLRDQHNHNPAASAPIRRGFNTDKSIVAAGGCNRMSGTMIAASVQTGA
jgi:hypothetical protein